MSTKFAIYVVALVLSIGITLISTVILAVILILCSCNDKQKVGKNGVKLEKVNI